MFSVLSNCWALFLGMGLIMLGNGLQGTLLGVRASMEQFGTTETGLIMSGYYVGLIFGCRFVPRLVGQVGHIRTFGALASFASTSILVQAVFVEQIIWLAMRFVTGFCYAGIFIVAESWLNESATNGTRGKLLSVYMLVLLGGTSGGQLMLNISSPLGYDLFVLASLLISIAVVPILLSTARAPQFEQQEQISFLQLYRVSQLGVFGMFVNGMCYGTIYGMGAVYATEIGMSVREVSLFMGVMILGGFLFQYPLGILSDMIGRKKVIVGCCIAGSLTSFYAMGFSGAGLTSFILVTVVGGFTMPVYALCGVHTNDYLTSTQMVAASGTLVLLSAAGAAIGAPVTAFLMDYLGSQAFYLSLSLMMATIALFALYRSTQRSEKGERGDFIPMPSTPLTAALNPDVGLEELEAAVETDIDEIESSIEELISEDNIVENSLEN